MVTPQPISPASRALRTRGFTVVELMTTIAILAILAAMAAPGFAAMIANNRLAGMSNELVSALQNARLEAVRRGRRVVVCPSELGAACDSTAQWRGFISFVDNNANGDLDSGETIIRAERIVAPVEVWASPAISAQNRIVFRSNGLAYDKPGNLMAGNLSPCLRTTNPAANARVVSLVTGTRFSVQSRTVLNGECNAPANPS